MPLPRTGRPRRAGRPRRSGRSVVMAPGRTRGAGRSGGAARPRGTGALVMVAVVREPRPQDALHGGIEFGQRRSERIGGFVERLPVGPIGRFDGRVIGFPRFFTGGRSRACRPGGDAVDRTRRPRRTGGALPVVVTMTPAVAARPRADAVQLGASRFEGLFLGFEGGAVGAALGRVWRGERSTCRLQSLDLGFVQPVGLSATIAAVGTPAQ